MPLPGLATPGPLSGHCGAHVRIGQRLVQRQARALHDLVDFPGGAAQRRCLAEEALRPGTESCRLVRSLRIDDGPAATDASAVWGVVRTR